MFERAPDVWHQFDWGQGVEPGQNLRNNKAFVAFAGHFVSMLDMAIEMLGPELELVENQLRMLGYRHVSYGVMPKHYPLMGMALLDTLKYLLDDEFGDKQRESWDAMYTFMSVTMMQGAFQELAKSETKLKKLEAETAKVEKNRSASRRASSSEDTYKTVDISEDSQSTGSLSSDDENLARNSSSVSATGKKTGAASRLAQRFSRAQV